MTDLIVVARQMLDLIEERKHYVTPNTESERPSFRSLSGCAGDAIDHWRKVISDYESVDEVDGLAGQHAARGGSAQ